MNTRTTWRLAGGAAALLLLLIGLVATNVEPSSMPRRGPPQQDMVLDEAMRSEVLERLITDLNGHYVFPETAKAMEAELRAREKRGDYANIHGAEAFAATLTEDLRRVTNDGHIDVVYSEAPFPPQAVLSSEEPSAEGVAEERRLNFGVARVERLSFNIGYLDLHAFGSPCIGSA